MNPEDFLLVVLAARLTPLQVDVLVDLTLRPDVKLREVAAEYGVSHSAIGQAAARARRKIRRMLALAA